MHLSQQIYGGSKGFEEKVMKAYDEKIIHVYRAYIIAGYRLLSLVTNLSVIVYYNEYEDLSN